MPEKIGFNTVTLGVPNIGARFQRMNLVLKGAGALLERYRPGIYSEFHGADQHEGTCLF